MKKIINDNFRLIVSVSLTSLWALMIGCFVGRQYNEKQITELKAELNQAKAQIKLLEENQVIVYYADSWGGRE